MIQITHWLDPDEIYQHPVTGEKTNKQFCEEIVEQINSDESRIASIKKNKLNKIAVFSNENGNDFITKPNQNLS